MRYLTVQGIILKKQNRGENDNFITIFSPQLGKFQAISKSSRKFTSSLIGHLEILNVCNFQIYKTANSYTITQSQLQKSYTDIRNNFNKTLFALLIIEITQKSVEKEEYGEEIFQLLMNTLDQIERSQNYEFIVETFKIKLLQLHGSLPEISFCFFCNKKWEIQEKIWIDVQGHLACFLCLNNKNKLSQKTFEMISFKLIKLIHYLSQNKFEGIKRISLTEEQKFQFRKIANIFLNNYLYQEINSERIIQRLLS